MPASVQRLPLLLLTTASIPCCTFAGNTCYTFPGISEAGCRNQNGCSWCARWKGYDGYDGSKCTNSFTTGADGDCVAGPGHASDNSKGWFYGYWSPDSPISSGQDETNSRGWRRSTQDEINSRGWRLDYWYWNPGGPRMIDCAGSYSSWGACSASCGGGTQSRTFTVTRTAAHGGNSCTHSDGHSESRTCNTRSCPPPPPSRCLGDQGTKSLSSTSIGLTPYAASDDCFWTLRCTDGLRPRLTFTSFDTESGYDYVYVYDGSSQDDPEIGSRRSGTAVPSAATATGSSMRVRFTSDGSRQERGFQATMTCIHSSFLGTKSLSSTSSSTSIGLTFYSPNFDGFWTLRCSGGLRPRLTFTSFDTESGYDYVYLYDGSSQDDPEIGSRRSGTAVPSAATATGSSMCVWFTSDGHRQERGFQATMTCIAAADEPSTQDSDHAGSTSAAILFVVAGFVAVLLAVGLGLFSFFSLRKQGGVVAPKKQPLLTTTVDNSMQPSATVVGRTLQKLAANSGACCCDMVGNCLVHGPQIPRDQRDSQAMTQIATVRAPCLASQSLQKLAAAEGSTRPAAAQTTNAKVVVKLRLQRDWCSGKFTLPSDPKGLRGTALKSSGEYQRTSQLISNVMNETAACYKCSLLVYACMLVCVVVLLVVLCSDSGSRRRLDDCDESYDGNCRSTTGTTYHYGYSASPCLPVAVAAYRRQLQEQAKLSKLASLLAQESRSSPSGTHWQLQSKGTKQPRWTYDIVVTTDAARARPSAL
eukprot:COSAG01_NODE_4206_length_5242_cov_3.075637_1_plen_756_part_00